MIWLGDESDSWRVGMSRSKRLGEARDTSPVPMTDSQNNSENGIATSLRYPNEMLRNDRTALCLSAGWLRVFLLGLADPFKYLVSRYHKLRRWMTAGYVKLLLPPRQSRGTSLGG